MSFIREFAYVFTVSEKARKFGLLVRVFVPAVLILSLSLPYVAPWIQISPVQTLAAVVYEVMIAAYLAGVKRLINMLKLVGVFLLLGFFLNTVSLILGYEPSDLLTIALRSLRIVAIVIAITLLFQLLSIGEIRYLLAKIGLKRYSEMLAVAMAQLPVTFMTFSEAYVVAKLKLGEKNLASLIKPLVVDSILNSRHLAEALYIHGIPPTPRPKLISPKDPLILVPAAFISIIHLLPH